MKSLYTLLLLMLLVACNAKAQELETRIVAKNLDTPWEILWGPDNWIWMTERGGTVSRVNPETGEKIELVKIHDVFEDGERGLMGMVLHRNFTQNPYVYVVYNTGTSNADTKIKIVQYTYANDKLSLPSLILGNIGGWWNHDGARLWIDTDNTLYVTIGDAANSSLAQNITSRNGKLLRMTLDGGVPSDNPFLGQPGYDPYIYSMGHRNAQGLVFANGKIYSSEHGANTNDEVNIIHKGKNYGWPNVEGFCDTGSEINFCNENDIVEPIAVFYENSTAAVCGMDFYKYDFIPEWHNSLLLTSLKGKTLFQMKLNEAGDEVIATNSYFINQYGRLRDICISPDGRVFLATSNHDGRGNPVEDDDRIIEIKIKDTGVEKKSDEAILAYPLPAKDHLYVEDAKNTSNLFKIIDLHGRVVFENHNFDGSFKWDLISSNGERISKGKYFIQIGKSSKLIAVD